MTILNYSRTRLQIGAVIFTFSAFFMVARDWLTSTVRSGMASRRLTDDFELEWLLPFMLLIPVAIVARMLYLLSGDLAAIRATPAGLEVTSFFSRRVLPWADLIGGHRVNYGSFLHRNRWFNIRYLVAGANCSMRVPLILTKRPSGGQMSLPEKIDKAREEALGSPASAGERLPGTGIDPDAAIARYLKAKAEAAAAAPPEQPAPPSEASSPPRQPARPAFGRKGLN